MKQTVQNDIVSLDFYEPHYRAQLKNYHLPEEQEYFTALPLEAIAACEQESDRHPFLIMCDKAPVGFFVLHGWAGVKNYSDNQNAILLRAYSIESSMQGKGIAKQSLLLLPTFVQHHFPNKNEIILTVNDTNVQAQNLYMKCGFEDRGLRVDGPKGELLVFHMELKNN
ncbi:GNAT family N-acetyltransferase [Paenibacillus sp. 481]|uniref:GNAT family N-acetyltransferase n=1 Tax=Paenibacillus sp. 481 TaxID=2835869 RepID=UPI001E5EF122|nr:GNAT family N-acetyltransferase [Paenibacillus sp. 481]UHA71888.1 GNAT family N-acetyltransferase [Paenibacillus sp. 481]